MKATNILDVCKNADEAIEKTIETLREKLKGSKGFALAVVSNTGGKELMIGHCGGGKLTVSDLSKLCLETIEFSKRYAAKRGQCDCPDCRAARASQTTH